MEPPKKIIDPAAIVDTFKKDPPKEIPKPEAPKAPEPVKTATKDPIDDEDTWGGLPSFLRRK